MQFLQSLARWQQGILSLCAMVATGSQVGVSMGRTWIEVIGDWETMWLGCGPCYFRRINYCTHINRFYYHHQLLS